MRKLNKKQKKVLDKWYETIKHEHGLAVRDVVQDLMPTEIWDELEALNDFETLYNHINRYINDKE
jgi:hypothetical protein